MGEASQKHNELVRDFVMRFGRECKTYSELMVVAESILTGCMQLNERLFDCKPQVAVGLVEAAVQRAIERYAESRT